MADIWQEGVLYHKSAINIDVGDNLCFDLPAHKLNHTISNYIIEAYVSAVVVSK